MDTSEGKTFQFDIKESLSRVEKHTLLGGIFLAGLVIGFVGVYMFVAQPILAQLGEVQRQSIALQKDMKLLVGARDQAWEASDLLAGLNSQHRQMQNARATLKDIRQLRQDLQAEAGHNAACVAALSQLSKLQESLVEQREMAEQAVKVLDELVQVQHRLVKEHSVTSQAEAALAGLDQTKAGLDALIGIKKQIVEGGQDAPTAAINAGELVALKKQIIEGGQDVPTAAISAGELVALKDQVVAHGGDTAAAKAQVDKLFGLQDQLSAHSSDMTPAFTALDGLLEIKEKLHNQTPEVADAMQNLEILSDFQDEFAERIRSLGAMQQSLMEIVMMETTVARVAKVIEPLLQISNVRRLGDGELRDAARMILEKRSATRISKNVGVERHLPILEEDPFKEEAAAPKAPAPVPVPLPLNDE